jgi:hypothetical protein
MRAVCAHTELPFLRVIERPSLMIHARLTNGQGCEHNHLTLTEGLKVAVTVAVNRSHGSGKASVSSLRARSIRSESKTPSTST